MGRDEGGTGTQQAVPVLQSDGSGVTARPHHNVAARRSGGGRRLNGGKRHSAVERSRGIATGRRVHKETVHGHHGDGHRTGNHTPGVAESIRKGVGPAEISRRRIGESPVLSPRDGAALSAGGGKGERGSVRRIVGQHTGGSGHRQGGVSVRGVGVILAYRSRDSRVVRVRKNEVIRASAPGPKKSPRQKQDCKSFLHE